MEIVLRLVPMNNILTPTQDKSYTYIYLIRMIDKIVIILIIIDDYLDSIYVL